MPLWYHIAKYFIVAGLIIFSIGFLIAHAEETIRLSSTRNNSNITLNDSDEDGGWFFNISTSTLDFDGTRIVLRTQLTEDGYGTRTGILTLKDLTLGSDIASSSITLYYVDTGDPNNASATINWEFGSPIGFNSTHSYQIKFVPSWTPSDHPFMLVQVCDGSVPADCYGGSYGVNSTSTMIADANTLPSLTHSFISPDAPIFTLYGQDSEILDSINLTYPNSSSTSAYFNNWTADITYSHLTYSTSTDYYFAWVYVSETSSTNINGILENSILQGSILTDCDYSLSTGCDINQQSTIQIPNTLAMKQNTDYFAQGSLVYSTPADRLGTLVATSSIIQFSTNGLTLEDTIYDPLYGYNATSTDIEDECTLSLNPNNLFNCASNFVNRTTTFLFVPSSGIWNLAKNQITSFQNVFPFNIIYGISNALTASLTEAQTEEGSTLTLSFPAVGSLTGFSLDLLSPTMLSDHIGSSTADMYFTLQANVIWLGTGIALLAMIL